jgi:hypothetical protein
MAQRGAEKYSVEKPQAWVTRNDLSPNDLNSTPHTALEDLF